MEKVEQNWKKSRNMVGGEIYLECFIFLYLSLGHGNPFIKFLHMKNSMVLKGEDLPYGCVAYVLQKGVWPMRVSGADMWSIHTP